MRKKLLIHRWVAIVYSLCLMMLATLSQAGAAPRAAPEPPGETTAESEVLPGAPAAWDTVEDTLDIPAEQSRDIATPLAATDCFGWPTKRVRYTSDGVIHLEGCGQTFTLGEVAASPLVGSAKLELVDAANKIWLIKSKLRVEEGATLQVVGGAAGDANWLRLRSDATSGIWLRAERGNLLFRDTKVTSWDASKNDVDRDISVASNGSGGRSYIATRTVLTHGRATASPTECGVSGGTQEPYESRMDVVNSEIGYLGYNAAESYGIVWKVYYKVDSAIPGDAPPPGRQLYALADVFGEVRNSTFHHNYFGSYTFGAYCMPWTNNLFADNVQYGLDPHDDSDYLTISDNVFRDNGNHGVICSVECNNIVIVNNQAYRNLHGIMIHRNVNGALIAGNISADNRKAGIAIFDSHDAVVRDNTVRNNGESAIRLSVGSSRNLIERNTLVSAAASTTANGYIVYTYRGSDAPTSGDGKPKDNVFRANQMTGVAPTVWKLGDSVGTVFENNTLAGSAPKIELQRSTGTQIRDMVPGTALSIKLDTASDIKLADTRGFVWQTSNGRDSTSASTGTNLALKLSSSGIVQATLRDLNVVPASGSVAVQPTTWDTSVREWRVKTTDTVESIAQRVGGLQAAACYTVTANNQPVGVFGADANGVVQFSQPLAANTTTTFRLTPSACSLPTEPTATASAPPTAVPAPLPQRVAFPFVNN